MKKLLLFPLIFLLALFSCMRQSRPFDRKLEKIDTLVMRNDNESALLLLGNIGRKQLETSSDSFFFNLLYVQAATQAAKKNMKETDIDKLIESNRILLFCR